MPRWIAMRRRNASSPARDAIGRLSRSALRSGGLESKDLRLRPGELELGKSALNRGLSVADLADDEAARLEVIRRLLEQARDQVEAIGAARKSEPRLVAIFRR